MKPTLLVISHGSREISANKEFVRLVDKYRKRHPDWRVAHAFLELAQPSIPEALEKLAKGGAQKISVLPLFFFQAKHVKEHIPAILSAFRKTHPQVKVTLAKPLGADPLLLDLLDQRLKQTSLK